MREEFLILSVLGLIVIIVISGCEGKQTDRFKCTKDGGRWKGFPDSCADTCAFIRGSDVGCKEVITPSCDCGPDKCWNGEGCEFN